MNHEFTFFNKHISVRHHTQCTHSTISSLLFSAPAAQTETVSVCTFCFTFLTAEKTKIT